MRNTFGFLHIDISNPWLLGAVEVGFILVLVVFVLVAGERVLRHLFTRFLQLFQREPDEKLLTDMHNAFRRVILLIALDAVVSVFPLPARIQGFVSNSVFVVITLLVLLSVFEMTNVMGEILKIKAREFEPLITKIFKIVASTIALMVVMKHFNYDIWHIMTALGVGTLAVGLAAQPTLSNMIAGFTILIDRPFRPGDRISLSGGETGDVIQIGMRSTRILTPDGNILVVSNSDMVNSRLTNYSMPNSHLGSKVQFYVKHDAPLNEIKTFVKGAVQNLPHLVKDSVQVLAAGMTDWGVEVKVYYNAEHFAQTGTLSDQIIDIVISEMRKRQIPFAVNPAASPK